MPHTSLIPKVLKTPRHRTAWLEAGPEDGPLMLFLHGWPELAILWRAQLEHFAALGWRCVAPDMRGYGGSSIPPHVSDYTVREIVSDMVELHDAVGAPPAVWVGHDHGSMIAWAVAMHHPDRCRGVVSLTVPHFARGIGLKTLLPLINRSVYPKARYSAGQWDYQLFYQEHFTKAVRDFEANRELLISMLFIPSSADAVGTPAPLASIRANGGWFTHGDFSSLPASTLMSQADRATFSDAFERNGFSGPCAWYLNDDDNLAFAAEANDFGRLSMPVLFIHADRDQVCDTAHSALADPMREDCANLSETVIQAGHMLMVESPDEVNRAIIGWLEAADLGAGPSG